MLCLGESQVFSNNMMNMSLRHGNASKITYQNVLIMGWKIGYSCRLSTWVDQGTHENMDAAAGGAFLSLTIPGATALVEKMASNQG